jgi:hypothetical protein
VSEWEIREREDRREERQEAEKFLQERDMVTGEERCTIYMLGIGQGGR